MKCNNCGSVWYAAGTVLSCPFCRMSVAIPQDEVRSIYASAMALPDERAEERAAALLTAAEQGDASARYALGLAYEEGRGVPRSPSRAAVWFRLAALDAHADAAFHLALSLRARYRGTPRADAAYFWLRVGAELGSAGARCLLGDCYESGEGIAENPLRAAYWYTLAAEDGDFRAAYRLAQLYRDGRGVRENPAYEKYYAEIAYNGGIRAAERLISRIDRRVFSEVPARIEVKNRNEDRFELGYRAYTEEKYTVAVRLYTLAAEDGYARAQNNLGVCYEKGHGVTRDETAAAFWYGQAAAGGYGMGYLNLGDCYRHGRGVEKNGATALACYRAAADGGFPRGQFVLAECYFNADLTDRDIPRALSYYEKAALAGYGPALERVNGIRTDMTELYNRGVDAYERGDFVTAVKYYTVAAEFGHRGAQCNLGYCYQHGKGCEINPRYAVHYYEKAAAQESGVAEFNLAACYLRGEGGLPYSYARARELLTRALRHGAKEAEPILAELAERRRRKLARRVYSTSAAVLHRGPDEVNDALKFRLIAAEMGNPRAMFAMGCHYEFGFGLPQDEARAASWYRRAVAAGYKSGSRMKSALLRMLKRPVGFKPVAMPQGDAPAAGAQSE